MQVFTQDGANTYGSKLQWGKYKSNGGEGGVDHMLTICIGTAYTVYPILKYAVGTQELDRFPIP